MSNGTPNPLAFQEREIKAVRTVKLKNPAAEKQKKEDQERAEYAAKFGQSVESSIQEDNDKNVFAVNVSKKFLKLSSDTTLARNKTSIMNNVEDSIRKEFIQLGIDMNNDESAEQDGMGSMICITVLSKVIMSQRDRINELEYQLQQLAKKIGSSSNESK
jgi:hypothetical protein